MSPVSGPIRAGFRAGITGTPQDISGGHCRSGADVFTNVG